MQAKFQVFRSLPQSEYRAVGENMLPQIAECIDSIDNYKKELRDQETKKFMEFIIGRGEAGEGNKIFYDIGGYSYGVSVTKTKSQIK